MTVHQDVWVGLVLLVLCGIIFGVTTTFSEVPEMLSQNIPPSFFPRLVLGVIACLSLLLSFRGLQISREPRSRLHPKVYLTAAVIGASVLLLNILGMFLTIAFLVLVLPVLWGERRFHWIGILAVGVPLAVYLIFSLTLEVRFPAGIFFPLLFS